MNRAAALLVAILLSLSACSSASDDTPPERRGGYGGGERVRSGGAPMQMGEGGGDTLPSPDWWRDPQISTAVKLTPEQYKSLDALSSDVAELDTLRRASTDAARDFRLVLSSDNPSHDDIVNAGRRMRDTRDALLDRNVQLLATERALLSKEQWQALQSAMRPHRDEMNGRRRGGYPGGGRGGRGGMGGMGGGRPGGWNW